MSAKLSKAVLTISVDLDRDVARLGADDADRSADIADRLLEIFAAHQMPATWSVAEPATSRSIDRIVARRAGHEIALWGDAPWMARDAGRGSFGRELARRAAAGRARGLSIATLVVDGTIVDDHCDLAIKQGITAVRHAPGANESKSRGGLPAKLRFGLWSFPVTHVLPGDSRWLPGGGGGRRLRVLLDRAIVVPGLVQLVVDASQLAARGYGAQRVLDRVLVHAEWRRRQGVLEVATLGAAAARLSCQTPNVPSRSILKAA